MRTVHSLAELADLVATESRTRKLYVRWTRDLDKDLSTGVSRDELTGIELPGLSANSLVVEAWWNGRPLTVWLARKLHDYRHLPEQRGPQTCPYVISGVECGRGPDNEPLVAHSTPLAVLSDEVINEAQETVARLGVDWGTMRRS